MNLKVHFSIIILVLGFFLMPNTTYACGSKSEKHSSKKEIASKIEKDDCCKKNDNKHACNRKCGHSNCTYSPSNFNFALFIELNSQNNTFNFSSEKQNFYYSKTNISSGYHSLWLIPKIG